ncbi:Sec63-domain-containing protein [Lentinula lateritia]|uniref:Sec63-domain-containing protein n=1 Tax=Lentinula aff. lateritia TaxID=2804960 RepID=A0ACC1U0S6_9AGAR|nr:Sec63-domain-containing protein [Lentinula aff. lateritia]KAJ3855634.1 Sec63-domain-containing protein [Lentinula lateritia]
MSSGIFGHLEFLVGSSQDFAGGDTSSIDDWTRSARDLLQSIEEDGAEIDVWPSVLDIYKHTENGQSTILSRLLIKPDVEHLLGSLQSILASPLHDDEISGELAELVGFDEIELVMDIIRNRHSLVQELQGRSILKDSDDSGAASLDPKLARLRIEQQLQENSARPLFTGVAGPEAEILPHVYTSSSTISQGNVLSHLGTRYLLPLGTQRSMKEEYEEVIIPPARPVPPKQTERFVPINGLDALAKGCFPGYETLNRIQSIVYPTAYGSNENMLICAPTGAGKTDVAMLTILRVLDQHRNSSSLSANIGASINRDSFKIIYVAPMKALASEIVRKFQKRLKWLSIQVRELTGDMQMTKVEIAQTQIIVTTPEKWDVVTRKPTGEGELVSTLKLLIVDEVHLLNEERGAVLETIVARTLRQVESTQSMIRIVGLSATLPNYVDVADFLSVSRQKGLFYFDSSFRPVPLEQHFLGIKGKPGSSQAKKNLDHVTFEKVSELVAQGHQVMVFVHARKETVKSALAIQEAALAEGSSDDFSCEDHPQWSLFRREIAQSRNKEMKQLFDHGFGIHHAGMLRSDRNIMERMFEARAIKVLCCTATLAWGVNLPAHAVVIKGTQVYNSSKGKFTDLSVLDVLQVFGRAGRPGLESSGEGYICTSDDKLAHYLELVTAQNPIESQFNKGIIDSLNAEIALGTVANTNDAVQWLGYTYLFVRMRKNPIVYGIDRNAVVDDPMLGSKRNELVTQAAQVLVHARMIEFDDQTGAFKITDLGRIAARYYIQYQSIEIFKKIFRPKMSEADVLGMLSKSTEFNQIQMRDNEERELRDLLNIVPCEVKVGVVITSEGKVNILLQAYISRCTLEDFALVSDSAYVAQNGGRIVRALLEIAISRKWANVSAVLMGMSKALEKRLWPFDQPLKQFDLKGDLIYHLESWGDDYSPADLATMSAEELGKLTHLNSIQGQALLNAAQQFPTVKIQSVLRPLGSEVLKVVVSLTKQFTWVSKLHGTSEPFWVWIEDHNGVNILQMSHLIVRPNTETIHLDFIIPITNEQTPPFITIRCVSDRWLGAENEIEVSLNNLIMPRPIQSMTALLDLPLLPLTALRRPEVEIMYSRRLHNFNSLQTQVLWSLTNTKSHSLFCAPAGSGKSIMADIVACSWVLVVAPRRSSAAEIISELHLVSRRSNATLELANSEKDLLQRPNVRTIRVVSAYHLFQAISLWDPRVPLLGLDLVVCENLDQMDGVYELGISLLRHATQMTPTRYLGISNSLNDAVDLAAWLNADESAFHSFRPTDRSQSLITSTQSFTIPHSGSLFKVMAKPAHSVIRQVISEDSAIVFVSSRTQCKATALDLLTQCALEDQSDRGYLPPGVHEYIRDDYLTRLEDSSLTDFLSKGVGFFHDGIKRSDRSLMLQLYAEGIVRVLIVPREACWSLPVRAAAVVVMGTQYWHFASQVDERQVREYDLTELVRMQSRAVRHSGSGQFHLFCQAEVKDTYVRFLTEGLPLESKLLENVLEEWLQSARTRGYLKSKQHLMDLLSFTFLARRVVTNPSYYDCHSRSQDENLSRFVDQLWSSE